MRDKSHVIQGGINELQTRSVDLSLFWGVLRHNWKYTRASLMRHAKLSYETYFSGSCGPDKCFNTVQPFVPQLVQNQGCAH